MSPSRITKLSDEDQRAIDESDRCRFGWREKGKYQRCIRPFDHPGRHVIRKPGVPGEFLGRAEGDTKSSEVA